MKFSLPFIHLPILLIFIFSSCSQPKESNLLSISIPDSFDNIVSISDLSDSIKLIELETRPNAMISNINDVVYDGKNLLVTNSDGRILIFGPEGDFIQKLGKNGDGPGEHKYVSAIAIDNQSKNIFIVTRGKILIYSSSYEFLEEIKLNFYLDYFQVFNNTCYGISNEYGKVVKNGFENVTKLYRLGPKMEVEDTIVLRTAIVESKIATILGYRDYMSSIDDNLYIYTPVTTNENILRDTLYQLIGEDLIPFAKLNFEKPHLSEKGIKKYWIANIVNTQSYISSVSYNQEDEIRMLLYNKVTEKCYNFKKGILDDQGDPVLLRPLDPGNDIFYFIKKDQFSDLKTEEKNPTIGIVKLKR